jgi:hypothetical protein
MQSLIIEKTKSTPTIIFDIKNGNFEITGRSLPEDAERFYQPVIQWLQLYLRNPNTVSTFVFELEYFNSASSKIFMQIFRLLNISFVNGINISIDWCYEDDDMDTLETGIDYSSMVKLPFVFNVMQNY